MSQAKKKLYENSNRMNTCCQRHLSSLLWYKSAFQEDCLLVPTRGARTKNVGEIKNQTFKYKPKIIFPQSVSKLSRFAKNISYQWWKETSGTHAVSLQKNMQCKRFGVGNDFNDLCTWEEFKWQYKLDTTAKIAELSFQLLILRIADVWHPLLCNFLNLCSYSYCV